MNTPKPPAPGTEAHRIALMAQLAQWLLNALGPVNALEVAGQVLGTLGSLATPPGASVSRPMKSCTFLKLNAPARPAAFQKWQARAW